MNIREMDWRQSSIRQILSALSEGLRTNVQRYDESGDVDSAVEYEDDLCGIAFVTAQTYITGVVSDVSALRVGQSPMNKYELLQIANPIVADTKLTRMQLCDTMANYYKHRDEWDNWKDSKARRTTDILRKAGFSESSLYLCSTVAKLLFGDEKLESLVPIVDMLSAWRFTVVMCEAL